MNSLRSPMLAIRVFLLDDQAMLRAGFRTLINQQQDLEVVGEACEVRQAIDQIEALSPDVILLDITMPGLSGIDAIPMILNCSPDSKIVMLSHHEGQSFIHQSLQAGAHGYLSKDSEPEELALAVRTVVHGKTYVSPKVTGVLVAQLRSGADPRPRGIQCLTPREREVFQLLALGNTNRVVASTLGISLGTAKKHRENLQHKLKTNSPARLARLAIREGLLSGN